MGSSRTRFRVSVNTVFATAGAIGGVPGSPMPPGCSSSTASTRYRTESTLGALTSTHTLSAMMRVAGVVEAGVGGRVDELGGEGRAKARA